MTKSFDLRIFGLFIFIVLAWGLGWPANKVGLEYMSPLWYTALRMIIGTITMMVLVIALKKFSIPARKDIPLIAAIGILQISLYMLLANLGMSYLPAGRSSLIAYTTPLWIMPATTLFFGEKAGPLKWFGFLLGIGGLVFLLSPWDLDWSNGKTVFGTAMLLLASLSWAISMLCVRYMEWSKSPLELIPWQLLIGAIPIVLFAWFKEPLFTITWNLPLILSLAYTGILVTGISYWSGVVINKALPTIVLSLGFLLVPVCSLLVSAHFMHEVISVSTAWAMTMILFGLICVVV